ncbi:20441_t:CDS:2 [Racocetra persica]|uniref:20441_t:CDS:1 n=1 Tax=Racocetra persica TaxID=160502 RepID=A0ACA9KJK8_9GLOM|nr:20441_t:CDS:2 [Racocetra persica]
MDLRSYFGQMRANGTPLSWNDKIALVQQMVDGLQYLHNQNIILSELHPKNIVMCEGIPKFTNLRMPQVRSKEEFTFSKYSPPEAFKPKPKSIDLELSLDYETLLKQKKMKTEFVRIFALNRGRNLNGFDFNRAEGIILDDNGDAKVLKSELSTPVVYNSLSTDSIWDNLRSTSLFTSNRENQELNNDNNQVQIHVPVSTVEYTSAASDKFIKDVENALEISDKTEQKKMLEKCFNYYGNYVVKKFTLGGVITIGNWLNASNKEKSYLKSYIQWGIDCGKGKATEIFEDVPLDTIPPLQTDGEMDTLGDLYNWFKSLYGLDFAKVIAYGKIIPSYKLLPDILQKKLLEISGCDPVEALEGELIPNVPIHYERKELVSWITLKPPLELFLLDFVHNNSLQYGVILQKSDLGHAKKAAFKFLRIPTVTEIRKVTLSLTETQNRQDAYLLENGIVLKDEDKLDLDNIPYAEYSSVLHHPLEDFKSAKNQPFQAIYCQITVHMAKLSFNLADIKSLQEYSNSVNTALQSNEPFKSICKIFGDDYGHLLSRTLTVGGILSKKCVLRTKKNLPERKIEYEFEINDPQIIDKINFQLKEWEKDFEVNTSFLIGNNGDIVGRDGIKPWLEYFQDLTINACRNWSIVAYEDWTPLYKILRRTSTNIDSTFGQYQIVFSGEELFQMDDQKTFIIRFPGFCSNKNRNLKVLYGNHSVNETPFEVALECKNLASNCVLITSIVSKDENAFYTIKPKAWSKSRIYLEITKDPLSDEYDTEGIADVFDDDGFDDKDSDGFDDKDSDDGTDKLDDEIEQAAQEITAQATTVLKWCVVYTDERKPMVSEANNLRTHNWNSFGEYLDDGIECLEEEDGDELDTQSGMLLEEAIEQHNLNDGRLFEAWKTFINCARKGDQVALYWIGFYLQYDILSASKFYLRRFYDEAIDEFAEGAESNLQAAMMLYKKSADAEYPEAQLRYGFGLYSGQGVPQDRENAIHYFRSSAMNKNHTAMYNLGIILILSGNDPDKAEGERWLREAARNNHQKAIDVCREHHIEIS